MIEPGTSTNVLKNVNWAQVSVSNGKLILVQLFHISIDILIMINAEEPSSDHNWKSIDGKPISTKLAFQAGFTS